MPILRVPIKDEARKNGLQDLRNGDYDRQVAAARALGKIYPVPTEAVPKLIILMAEEFKTCANSAKDIQEIQQIGYQLFDACEAAVKGTGAAAYPRVCESLEAADIETRLIAVYILQNKLDQLIPQNKLQKTKRTAMNALNDSRWLIRLFGVLTLGEIPPIEDSLHRLREFLNSEEHPDVRELAEECLE